MTAITFETFDAPVEAMFAVLDSALSPVGVAAFLSGYVDPYLRGRAATRFASEGDSAVGGKWKPLSPATEGIRANLGYGAAHPINVRTGELEDFITGNRADVMVHPWGASATLPGAPAVGELEDKLRHAQQGGIGESSGRAFPARPVLGLDSKDMVAVLSFLSTFIQKKSAAAGFLI